MGRLDTLERAMTIETIENAKKTRKKLKPPKNYAVFLHNDDYTPMEFVVFVLQEIYHKNTQVAERIMLEVHEKGKGIAGVYTHEIAEQKVFDTIDISRQNEFPLQVTAEIVE